MVGISTATPSSPAITDAAPVTLAAANPNRKGLYVYNDNSAALFIKLGPDAADNDFSTKIMSAGFWELPSGGGIIYTGPVTARAAAGGVGDAYVTEL